jgi:hypothetical protein
VYATRATDERARRLKNLILQIKTDRVDAGTGMPVVRLTVERVVGRLDEVDRQVFAGHPVLVPVPGSGLTKANSVWPARRICEELVRQRLGEDVVPVINRTTAVSKSAGSATRPTLAQHLTSFTIQPGLTPPGRLLVVDDVVTSGTTLMACALALARAYPRIPISGFALARVLSSGNPAFVLEPLVERVVVDGTRCRRVSA